MARCGLSVTSSWLAAPHFLQDGRRAWGALRPHTEASWWGPLQDAAPGGAVVRAVSCTPSDLTPVSRHPGPGSCPQMWQLQVPPRGPTRQDHQDWEDQDQDQDQGWEDSAPSAH